MIERARTTNRLRTKRAFTYVGDQSVADQPSIETRLDAYLFARPSLTNASFGLAIALMCAVAISGMIKVDMGIDLQATVRPQGDAILLSFPEDGTVAQLLVREGDTVRVGTALATLAYNDIPIREERNRVESSRTNTELRAVRIAFLAVRTSADPTTLRRSPVEPGTTAAYAIMKIASELEAAESESQRARTLFAVQQSLAAAKAGAKVDLELARIGVAHSDAEARKVRDEAISNLAASVTSLQADSLRLASEHAMLYSQRKEYVLTAPSAGVVSGMNMLRPGRTVRTGEPILSILPASQLVLVGAIPGSARGRAHVGQRTVVRFESFPSLRYGTASGTLLSISPDATNEQPGVPVGYRAVCTFDEMNFERRIATGERIEPGMRATIRIITKSEPLLLYFADRFIRTRA